MSKHKVDSQISKDYVFVTGLLQIAGAFVNRNWSIDISQPPFYNAETTYLKPQTLQSASAVEIHEAGRHCLNESGQEKLKTFL